MDLEAGTGIIVWIVVAVYTPILITCMLIVMAALVVYLREVK